MSAQHAQKRVFAKWVSLQSEWPNLTEENLIDSFQDGRLLLQLLESLTRADSGIKSTSTSTNQLQTIGRLSDILSFGVAQGLQFSVSADNIYKKDETMIMGLIWGLILKFQVGRKTELLQWIGDLLQSPIRNFDSSWKDGHLFCKLVDKLIALKEGRASESESPSYPAGDTADESLQRLAYAFSTAQHKLGIREMLAPEDVMAGYLDERSNLTYLSTFYQQYHSLSSSSTPASSSTSQAESDRIAQLEARIRQLEEELSQRDRTLQQTQAQVVDLVSSTQEIQQDVVEQKEANEAMQKKLEAWELQLPFQCSPSSSSSSRTPPATEQVTLAIVSLSDADTHWQEDAPATAKCVQRLHTLARDLATTTAGYEVTASSEQMTFAFEESPMAMQFAVKLQEVLAQQEWPERFHQFGLPMFPVAMAVHAGAMKWSGSSYTGQSCLLASRMAGAARPGEIITSQTCWDRCVESPEFQSSMQPTITLSSLGHYESPSAIDILQLFPESLKERGTHYGEFEFLSATEKAQRDLQKQLALLQEENEKLMEKLQATEQKASQARERASQLYDSLQEARRESSSQGSNVQAAMQEVSHLVTETETLQRELAFANNRLKNARQVMTGMNGKLQSIAARNHILEQEIVESQTTQDSLRNELAQLENLLSGKKSGRKSLLHMIIPTRKKTAPPRLSVSSDDGLLAPVPLTRARTDEGGQLDPPSSKTKKRRLSSGDKKK